MKTTTVGEVQKNFSRILRNIWAGEKIVVTKGGKPVARIEALGGRVLSTDTGLAGRNHLCR